VKTLTTIVALVLLLASPALAIQANLSWTNPSDPSVTGINVQKATSAAGPFTTVNTAPLAPTVSTFSDPTITVGAQVCYQVVWVNALGASQPLGPGCGTPNAAQKGSGLTIIFQP